MAAIAVMPMPNPNFPRADEFGEVGFTQDDRDALKKQGWLLESIDKRLDSFDRRLAKLEEERAHQKDLDEFRRRWEAGHEEFREAIDDLRIKAAVIYAIGGAILAVEPILIKLFWH